MNKKLILTLTVTILVLAACTQQTPSTDGTEGKISGGQGKPPSQCVCTQQYDPVCGSDGKTYGNSCTAACAGVTASPGECAVR